MSKQDRTYTRTAAELEQKHGFGKRFSEMLGIIDDTRDKVDSVESSLSGVKGNVATIKRIVDNEGARISQVVEAVGKDGKISAASIVAAVNKEGSSVLIDADHINFEAENYKIHADKIDFEGSQFEAQMSEGITLSVKEYVDSRRNLLLHSGTTVVNSEYHIASYALANTPVVGETYTITLKGKLGAGKTRFAAYNSGGMVSLAVLDRVGESDLYTKTFAWNNTYGAGTVVSDTYVSMYVFDSATVAESEIEWIQLEKGDTATKNWTPAPEDMPAAEAEIKALPGTISLKVENGSIGNTASIVLTAGDEEKKASINLTGAVTIDDLKTGGKTVINGSNITTGVIKSKNYSYESGDYATNGTAIDLETGYIRSKNFSIDENGDAYLKGKITATSGEIGGCAIDASGKLLVSAANISDKLTADNLDVNSLSAITSDVGTLTAGTIQSSNYAAGKSGMKLDLTNGTADITGKLHAGKGSSLGTWDVDSNSIYTGSWSNATGRVFMATGSLNNAYTIGGYSSKDWVFGAGDAYGVTKDGALYTTKGKIGNWTISGGALRYTADMTNDDNVTNVMVVSDNKTYNCKIATDTTISTQGVITQIKGIVETVNSGAHADAMTPDEFKEHYKITTLNLAEGTIIQGDTRTLYWSDLRQLVK